MPRSMNETKMMFDVQKSRFDILDILRFGAAMAVVLFHLGFRGWIEDSSGYIAFPLLAPLAKYGYLGVDTFFLISGFVILLTALRRSAGGFVASRITRLYPAYWFCVCIAFASYYLIDGRTDGQAWLTWLANLTMLQTFFGLQHIDGVYWTLVVELRFYLLVFLLVLAGQAKRIEAALWIWLLVVLATDYKLLVLPIWLEAALIKGWAHYFIAGAGFYLVWLKGFSLLRGTLLALCALRAVQHAYWFMLLKVKLTGVPMDRWIVTTIVLAMFVLFLAIALHKLDGLRVGRLARVGVLTYPLYLIHDVVARQALYGQLVPGFASFQLLSVLLISLVCAWLIYRWIERPLSAKLSGWLHPMLDRRLGHKAVRP